jgi:hypothetical protein
MQLDRQRRGGRQGMSSKLSVEQILANLEKRLENHREKEAFHALKEAHHREQRELHAAEANTVSQSLEAFRGIAPVAIDLARLVPASPVPVSQEALPPPGRLMASRLVRLTVQSPSFAQPFGPTAVTQELNRRFAGRLRKPVGSRMVSNVLRRMLAEGEIELVREGKALHEALYTRRPRS